jgi:hypothetical protein
MGARIVQRSDEDSFDIRAQSAVASRFCCHQIDSFVDRFALGGMSELPCPQ